MEVVCEEVDAAPAPEQEPPAAPEPETPKSRGRPKGAPNKVKEPKAPPPEPVPAPKAKPREKREKREKLEKPREPEQRAASPPPFEPTFEELLGHMGRAMAQQRAVRAQARLDLYSQFLS